MKKIFTGLALTLTMLAGVAFAQTENKLPDWTFGGFQRPAGVNPVISPDSTTTFFCPMNKRQVDWESNDTFNPAATIKDGKIVVLYRAEDKAGRAIGKRTSRLGYAESEDGITFKRRKEPVLYPAEDGQKKNEWPGGCEDPRVAVTEDGLYVIIYTQWNQDKARLGIATSRDLLKWEKHGPAFSKAFNGKFNEIWSKSGSIITKLVGDKQVIAKINGKYWLYFGEANVNLASSTDLINWTPLVDKNENLVNLISPRKGFFDSNLTECGPPAIVTEKGIVLLYNGKNDKGEDGDKRFTPNSYCAGQVLFDKNDPSKVLARLDVPFFRPMESFEKSGQYVAGTVFIEGMVYFKNKWLLYYGCADSRVGVAVYDPKTKTPGDPLP
ncbi:glycoside hydrolase family 130 protein [Dyadobacter fanqingshengii]|uniref:Glycoside hydrolase family 130 protein n=1 Tax=Dyadobacter fanqingshengii TaxID=2906443 RepID=A0A9X1TBJ8_9BACT|nr:glycoside hydrolase family 130 protein [Dyadobacter fanqingshengii]MCF0042936.1 glycoside hydrolase family 130 protein [Dyadobacter fanqingshengii]USJ35491.1 glycoside hydrolase family 130 protein [Dyadobacter fanqingshengii]